jgi:hypothetical protein
MVMPWFSIFRDGMRSVPSKLCFYAGLLDANMLVLGLRAISFVSGQELDCLQMRNLLLKKIWRSIASQSSSTILFNGEPLKM